MTIVEQVRKALIEGESTVNSHAEAAGISEASLSRFESQQGLSMEDLGSLSAELGLMINRNGVSK